METYSRSVHRIIKLAGVLMIGVMVCLGTVAWFHWAIYPGQRWKVMNGQAKHAYEAGDYASGSTLAKQAYDLARQAFGERDPRTLASLHGLALLYRIVPVGLLDCQKSYG